MDKKIILSKIHDYKITDYPTKLEKMMRSIKEIIYSDSFHNELSRFIPLEVQERTLKNEKFKDFLINETKLLLSELKMIVDDEEKRGPEFQI